MSNKLNSFIKIKYAKTEIEPPIKPEKKGVKKCNRIFDVKLPSKLVGIAIKMNFMINDTNLKLKFGRVFLIFAIFKMEIVVIERKKETIIEFIPIIGVKTIKLINKIIEPIM